MKANHLRNLESAWERGNSRAVAVAITAAVADGDLPRTLKTQYDRADDDQDFDACCGVWEHACYLLDEACHV